ncbi:MAG: polyribonucleotide nucleotidyltransferase [Chitinophagales bacterium]
MSLQAISKSIDVGNGKVISIETGKMARQADGAVLLRMGKAAILATVVSAKKPREGINFFPLSVDYQEKFASAGRIPGSFHKREGRLSEHEILICRLVDRALRPMFPDGYRNDTQVLLYLHSSDPEVMPDALACFAASAALSISDIPFSTPISEVRVARVDGEYIVNPSRSELAEADMEIMLAADKENIIMVEGEGHEISEAELVEAIRVGHEAIKLQCVFQEELRAECGKTKREVVPAEENAEVKAMVSEFARERIYEVAKAASSKAERKDAFKAIKDDLMASLGEEPAEGVADFASEYFYKLEKEVVRAMILNDRVRLDGRQLDEIRQLDIEVGLLDSPHGCALFTRGETQSLTTCTLGNKRDELMLDKANGVGHTNFFLHYNFPPFSVGEARPIRGTSRREVGHGNLALRSLKQVFPSREDNPYTVRVVSDILESNGSSSMATVCAGSLALMDAGVQTKGGVSGIAMGLITEGEKFAVLSDILGDEDHLGDMDFKVAGTKEGICGIQMDIKIKGLSYEILIQALEQAKAGRLHILAAMDAVLDTPRSEPKDHAPRIEKLYVDQEFIGAIIGPGGKVIQEIQSTTNTSIHIEETDDGRGEVLISSTDSEGLEAAKQRIRGIVAVPEVGAVYPSTVKTITAYGAFVEFLPGKEGLLHISEVSWTRLPSLEGVLEVGDEVKVKLLDVDKRTGKYKLSRKVLIAKPEGYVERERSDRGDRGDRGGRGGDRRGGGGGRGGRRY